MAASSAESAAPKEALLLDAKKREAVIEEAFRLRSARYLFGASIERDDAVDCSSLVLKAFRPHGLPLPRTAYGQSKRGRRISLSEIQRGDRLYFKMTDRPVPIDHTALYLGKGRILHAFPGLNVAIDELSNYRSYLVLARR